MKEIEDFNQNDWDDMRECAEGSVQYYAFQDWDEVMNKVVSTNGKRSALSFVLFYEGYKAAYERYVLKTKQDEEGESD